MTVLLPYTLQYGAHALEQSLPSWRSPELSVASRLMMGACKPLSLHAGALMQTPIATVSPEDTVSPNPLQPLAPSSSWCSLCLRAGGVIKMSCYDRPSPLQTLILWASTAVSFCINSHLLHKEISPMRTESCINL